MRSIKFKNYFKAGVSVFLFFFLVNKIDFSKLSILKWDILWVLVLTVSITLLTLFVMTVRWSILCTSLGVKSELLSLYKYYLKGMFYNIFLPGAIGGDMSRTKSLIDSSKLSVKKASSITIVERVSGLYMLLLMFAFGLSVLGVPKGLKLPFNSEYLPFILVVALLFVPLVKWFVNKKVHIGYRVVFPVLITSFIGQLGDVLIAWLFCHYFELAIGIEELIIVMPLVFFATVLPISLGGLGVREGVFVGVLSLYAIDTQMAIVVSFLMYFTKVFVGIIGWGVYLSQKQISKN